MFHYTTKRDLQNKNHGACLQLRPQEFRPYRLGLDVLIQIIHLGVILSTPALVTRSLEMSIVVLSHISLPGHPLWAHRTDHRRAMDPEMLPNKFVSRSGWYSLSLVELTFWLQVWKTGEHTQAKYRNRLRTRSFHRVQRVYPPLQTPSVWTIALPQRWESQPRLLGAPSQ